jgi:lysophospholipid acyltransferase (LPLAT)-like uncharacterized protein
MSDPSQSRHVERSSTVRDHASESGSESRSASATPNGADDRRDRAVRGEPAADGACETQEHASVSRAAVANAAVDASELVDGGELNARAVAQQKPRDALSLRKRMRRWKRRLGRRLTYWFGPLALRALARTWKITRIGEEHLRSERDSRQGRIVAIWHGRLLAPLPYHARRKWFILVSRSGDGDVVSDLLERFGYRLIRGSSSRGGALALRQMSQALGDDSVLVVTPDGPRGPRHRVQPGLVWIARETGFAVLPCGVACDRAWRARSWDRFLIPKPGAHVVFVYGAPIEIPPTATETELEKASATIRALMLDAEQRGFALLQKEPDW